MWSRVKACFSGLLLSFFAVLVVLTGRAHAAFTLPTLPVTDVEAAGTAVAALIATVVVIGVVFRMLKKA